MTAENAVAPIPQDRGDEKQRALDLRGNRNTTLLRARPRRTLEPTSYYPRHLLELSEPDERGRAVARCPLHPDPNRSLDVTLAGDLGEWRCRSCSAHGDLIDFHMRRNALTFELAALDLRNMARSMANRPSRNATSMFALCRAIAERGERLSPHELATFERQKAEQRARDEGVWRNEGAT